MKVAGSLEHLKHFLAEAVQASSFTLEPAKLSGQVEWMVMDGALSHRSGGYFDVIGLRDPVTSDERLMFYQPQGAITGLLMASRNGVVHVMLQARVEPGNTGIGQYGPTIQSTPANYLRAHGGRQTPFTAMFRCFDARARVLANSMQLDLGKRYFQKSKSHVYVETTELIDTERNMIWVPMPVILEALETDHFLNADLRSLLSVFDWSAYMDGDEAIRPDMPPQPLLTDMVMQRSLAAAPWHVVPLSTLGSWRLTDTGLEDTADTGVSVALYRTTCTNREVDQWVQPLMQADSKGCVDLYMRQREKGPQFLLSLKAECGISGAVAVAPTRVVYPGEPHEDIGASASVVAEIEQSDEGGRFLHHETVYRLLEVDQDLPVGDHQYWVDAAVLKKLLGMSDVVSFQLRCMVSLILPMLHPRIMGAVQPGQSPCPSTGS